MTIELFCTDIALDAPHTRRSSPLVGLAMTAVASAALWTLLIYAARQVF